MRNRYYYQTRIPIKDGIILAKARTPPSGAPGSAASTITTATARARAGSSCGCASPRQSGSTAREVASLRDVLPGVRRACDAYVRFVSGHDLLESVASSLTELVAGGLMAERIACFEKHYPWVRTEGLRYFRSRTEQAPRDAAEGLALVLEQATSDEDQERCARALLRKCEILWSLLDGVEWGAPRLRLAAGAQLRDDDGDGPLVVLAERAVQLNGTGREILGLADGTRSVCGVAAALRARHREPPEIEREAYAFLEEMEKLGVLEAAR